MSETEFAADPAAAAPAPSTFPSAADSAPAAPQRPGFIPEKFWDDGSGRVRVEDLAKSYRALERKLGRAAGTQSEDAAAPAPMPEPAAPDSGDEPPEVESAAAPAAEMPASAADGEFDVTVPATPEDYAVAVSHPWLERDGEIDGLLHAAGFNQTQAQLVYDLAAERVVPVIERMAADFERRLAQAKLESHFGGPERFAGIARQVKAWGERHLPKPLYETLSASPDGIAALHHMMRAGEPRFVAGDAPAAGPSQDELDRIVRDPRYWRDHDAQLVKRVEEGFRRLYPGE